MTAVADETQDLAALPTRRDVVWTAAAAPAGLGVVVNAAAPRAAVSPVIATAMSIGAVLAGAPLAPLAVLAAAQELLDGGAPASAPRWPGRQPGRVWSAQPCWAPAGCGRRRT